MKKIGLLLVALAVNFSLSAQQLSMFSQYYWNDFVINPAFTGIKNTPRVQLGYRNQWSGFNGAPKTYTLGGHTSLKNTNMGVGGMIFSDDQGGAIQQNGVMLNYSYNLKLDKESGISFGIAGILNQYGYNGSDIQNINPDATLQANVRQLVPDLNFGMVYHFKNRLHLGLASSQLIQSRLKKLNQFSTSENQLIRHYNLSASYLTKINSTLTAEPYAMLRTTFIKAPQFELGAKVTYNEFVFGGLSYRNRESVIGLIGLNYKNFVLAYSYDLTLTSIRNYSSGSHEVLFAYQFNNKSKKPQLNIEQPTEPKDSDGDGVFDDLDECPNVVGTKDNKGCPWPDSDKDGLSDNKDECPKIAGPIENRGCPYGDTDGDGLNDNEDECPKTSGPVTNKGCPIIEKKDQEVVDVAVKNLEFKTNQTVIQQISFPSLNTLVEKLKEKENWILNLSGHTDNLGDDDANMILSKNRSEAVKQYLISQGISESRIKVNYFGETKPIADNNSSEGRQKNRRVEFVIGFE